MNTTAPPPILPESTGEHQAPRSRRGSPVWEIAHLFPRQGDWSEEAYFNLEAEQRIEYADGCLEFLPIPTRSHELIVQFLFRLLDDLVRGRDAGHVFFSGYRVRTVDVAYRLPDLLFISKGRRHEEQFAQGAGIAIEVVSEGRENRERDCDEKRSEYAAARIPEYGIVDPQEKMITVLVFDGDQYSVHGKFKPGETATSVLLDGFTVNVAACFASATDGPGAAGARD